LKERTTKLKLDSTRSKLLARSTALERLGKKLALYERSKFNEPSMAVEHNTPEGMDRYYRDPTKVSKYDEPLTEAFHRSVFNWIQKLGVDFGDKEILDCGCGPGFLLRFLVERSTPRTVTGYDFSPGAIEIARTELPQGQFSQRDLYDPITEKFDVIICTETLEHLTDPALVLNNMIGALKPKGVLILSVPDGRIDTSLLHVNFWSPESWTAFLKASPATVVAVDLLQPMADLQVRYNVGLLRVQS
jgi:2-polyprenyl-3-methyl-5-hydroxy-6-metoxy-1,4-benzoquinol methylase